MHGLGPGRRWCKSNHPDEVIRAYLRSRDRGCYREGAGASPAGRTSERRIFLGVAQQQELAAWDRKGVGASPTIQTNRHNTSSVERDLEDLRA
jgi:hypothetical protein